MSFREPPIFRLRKNRRFGRDPFALLIVFLAGLGTVHILVRTTTYGAAVLYDSSYFLSTAVNFLAGEGWRHLYGRPLVGWPPLFPLLLAAGGWVGIDPLAAGRLINAAVFGLIILAAGCWLRSNLRSQWLALAASAVIATSLPLSHWASCIMTDSLFVLLTLLALIQLASFLQRGGRMPLLGGAVCTALVALTRYPGVVLIGVGVLLLLVGRTLPLAARLKDAVAYGAVSSIPLAGVLTHNWAISGYLTGWRDGAGQSSSDGLRQVPNVFRDWVIPANAPDGLGYLLWTAGVAVVLAGLGFGLSDEGWRRKDRPAPPLLGLGPALPFGVFTLIYLAFMVAVVPFTVAQGIDSRYLLPIYVPLLLAAVFLLDRFLSQRGSGFVVAKWSLASSVLLGLSAHIGYSTHRNLHITRQAWSDGFFRWTFNSSYWEFSETRNYTQTNFSSDDWIYSNFPPLVWFWNRTAALGKHHLLPDNLHHLTSDIMQGSDDDSPYIVWLRRKRPLYDYDHLDIRLLPGVEPVAELSDGVVFRVTATEPFDADRHRARKQRYVQQLIQRAGEPVVRAGWAIYRNGRTLTYRKQPCLPDDEKTNFVLDVIPDDPADLPADRRPYGFDGLGFNFHTHGGVQLDDQCVATVQLPDYPISRIRVGLSFAQEDRNILGGEFSIAEDSSYGESSEILKYIRDNPMDSPIYSNHYLLAWFWDRTAAPGKHQPLPDDLRHLTSAIMQGSDDDTPYIVWLQSGKSFYGYNDLDLRLLPGVEPVAELSDGVVFRVTATEPFDAKRHRAQKQRYVQQLIEQAGEHVIRADSTWPISTWGAERAGTDEQVARAGWDVYRTGRTLTYRKQPCAPDDVQTNFVLQVIPVDPEDLPAHRQPSGFDNLDFNFYTHGGVRLDDQCVATTQLPDYPISRIYIGRWMDGNNRMLWEMEAEGL